MFGIGLGLELELDWSGLGDGGSDGGAVLQLREPTVPFGTLPCARPVGRDRGGKKVLQKSSTGAG